jgi:hypothetical protein
MLVILEGPDGAGKTSLAGALEQLLVRDDPTCRVTRVKAGSPTRHPLDEYLRPVEPYRPGINSHWILDRWHWGEYVYPRVRNRASQLDPPAWWAIEAYLRRLGAVVVLCAQYPDRYRQVYRDRGESEEQADELPLVDKLYRQVLGLTQLPVVHFNWESGVNGDVFRVVDAARAAEFDAARLDFARTYLGPPNPEMLLLGDVRHGLGDDPHPELNLDPAFVPFRGTSGHYLLSALLAETSREFRRDARLGIANACDVDDPYQLWNVLGRPTVVTLGRNAERRWRDLRKSDGTRSTVPHPQYVRRFHHSMQLGYGMLIWATAAYGGDNGSWPLSSRQPPAAGRTSRSSNASDAGVANVPVATAR